MNLLSKTDSNLLVILGVTIVFLCFEFCKKIPVFIARKGTHMLSGVLLMMVTYNVYIRLFIIAFAAFVVYQCWFPLRPWRFAAPKDIGVTFFGIIVSLWSIFQIPMPVLAPLFFADPMGAIIGKNIKSFQICGRKTFAGTLAVFATAYLTCCTFLDSASLRFALAVCIAFAEAKGGDYDNAIVSIPLVIFYCLFGKQIPLSQCLLKL